MTDANVVIRESAEPVALSGTPQPLIHFSKEERNLLGKDMTDSELSVAVRLCQHLNLDPFAGQVAFTVYNKRDPDKRKLVPVITADGFRRIAMDSGNYGGSGNFRLLCKTKDGERVTVKHEEFDPDFHTTIISGTVDVYRLDTPHVQSATCVFKQYAKTGAGDEVWKKHPDLMILKCAEVAALRKAFPKKMGGIYIEEELPIDVGSQQPPPAQKKGAKTKRLATEEPPPPKVAEAPDSKAIIKQEFDKMYKELLKRDCADSKEARNFILMCCKKHFEVESLFDLPVDLVLDLHDYMLGPLVTEELRPENFMPMPREREL